MADAYQLKAILSATDKISPTLLGVAKSAANARKYLADMATAAGKVGSGMGLPMAAITGILSGFSLGAVKNAVVGFTNLGDAVLKGSQRTGMSVEEYQRMKYVAEQAGVGVETLEGSMGKLNAQTAKAAAGQNKSLSGLYQRLGISVRDSNGEVRSAVDLLPELADAFKKNTNPAVQARMGMALFGKQWAQIIPLLAEGSEALLKMSKRYEILKGMGLDKKNAREAKELGNQFMDLDWAFKGFQNTIAKELVPVIKPLVEDIIQWAAANRKLVASRVKEFVSDLVVTLKSIDWSGMIQSVKNFGSTFGKALDFVGAKNALVALVLYMNMQTLAAFASFVGAIWRAGAALVGFAITTIPQALAAFGLYTPATVAAAGATDVLAASTTTANAASSAWLVNLRAILGVLGSITLAAAPLAAMWAVKEWTEDTSNDQGRVQGVQQNFGAPAKGFLSMFGFDKDAEIENRQNLNRADLISGGPSVKASSEVTVTFKDAPPGMRVEQATGSGNAPVDVNVGYRSLSYGLPG